VTLFYKISLTIFVLSFAFSKADAQLCQGSLGDPIVNITFGAGSNPGAPLTAATTSYQYVSTDCPNDGYYAVRNSTASCFGNSWHSLSKDHTGDPSGYFMLVNASFQPSAFYLDTVRGLCSGTTYEFAAWVINVLLPTACGSNGIQPNLTFTIEKTDGTVLQSYNTGNIPHQSTTSWQQFGFFFSTPVGVSDIVLRIFNNSPGGCGNDLALDDITFRPCGPQITASINNYNTNTLTICADTARTFTFNATVSAGFNNPAFQWQQSINGGAWTDIPGATTTSLTKSFPASAASGNYAYRLSAAEAGNLSSAKCRVVSQPLTIKIVTNPVTTVTANSPLCEGNTLSLTATGGSTYQWSGVNNFSTTGSPVSINNAQSIHSGKYYVLATNSDGCSHRDSVTVSINPNPVAGTSFTTAKICQGDDLQLQSSGGGTYKWIPSSGLSSNFIANPIASPADTTNYMLIVTNPFNCSDTAFVLVNVVEAPHADAGPDKTIIKDNSTQLSANVKGQNVIYSWSPSLYMTSTQSLQPIVTPPSDIDYVLTVTSNEGCGIDEDSVHVFVFADVFIPTAFTPNGDGKNDTWYVPVLNAFTEFEVSVYNRYGQVVFHSKNVNKPWDGKYNGAVLPSDAYVYMINIKEVKKIYKGTVMLIR
jgi:gliding motility-associated-like protein